MTTVTLITIFVSLYLAHFFLDAILSYINIQHQKKYQKPPEIFAPYIPQERYEKSLAYNQEHYRLDTISTTISSIIFLAFVYTGLLNSLDIWLRGYISSDVHRGILFFMILAGGSWVIGIPFDLYGTFVIEQKFGFNQQTWKLWMKDQVKSLLLSCIILIPLGYAVFAFMQFSGMYWWLYCWLLFFGYSLFIAQVYPIWIAPIFNKFTPLAEGELRTKIQALAQKANFPMANIYIMDATTRSKHSNAYFAGFGKTKRLVLYDTLIQDFTTDEILTIVAHEMGHYHKKHIIKHLIVSQVTTLAFLYFLSLAISHPYLYQTFLVQNYPSIYLGLLLLSFVTSIIMAFFSPLFNLQSWKYETEADHYGYDLTQNAEATKTMFIKLAEKNLSNLTPHPIYARFYYSHPPIWQRLKNLGLAS